MAATLFTIGYEGLSIDAFVARLQSAGVRAVIDVRELPLSRKPGFSKRRFAETLHRAGFVYAHQRALGCPKPIRKQYKADGDWDAYTKAFSRYLAGQDKAVADLAAYANDTSSCLVCFEADFNRCHRHIVARAAAQVGHLRVSHLTAKAAIPDSSVRVAASGVDHTDGKSAGGTLRNKKAQAGISRL
jgi:uncharacterized protein (DUF488 family)